MQSFSLLALKLRPCIDYNGKYRQLLWFEIYIVRSTVSVQINFYLTDLGYMFIRVVTVLTDLLVAD